MDYILEKMNELNADSVDFIPFDAYLAQNNYPICKIVASYTKEEWSQGGCAYPKTPYRFWKMIDGEKEYCEM